MSSGFTIKSRSVNKNVKNSAFKYEREASVNLRKMMKATKAKQFANARSDGKIAGNEITQADSSLAVHGQYQGLLGKIKGLK